MARTDLLLALIKNSLSGNTLGVKKVVEAIIAEERLKQRKVIAEKLEELLKTELMNAIIQNGNKIFPEQKLNGIFYELTPKKKLSQLILSDSIRQICKEFIEEQHRADLLRSYNLEPRNRLLFIGPPGNGKTSLAEAIAESLIVPLIVVRYEGIVGAYLGETATRIKNLFEYVSSRNCVLFFDEFETLGKERGDVHETGEIKRVVSSLLLQIDKLPSYVIVIGATNHPELLDRAVWRRFQIRITLENPTLSDLIEFFKNFEQRHKIPLGYSPDVLAKKLEGLSFAEVEEFGLSILRQYVLGLPNSEMKEIISKNLKTWNFRTANLKKNKRKI